MTETDAPLSQISEESLPQHRREERLQRIRAIAELRKAKRESEQENELSAESLEVTADAHSDLWEEQEVAPESENEEIFRGHESDEALPGTRHPNDGKRVA